MSDNLDRLLSDGDLDELLRLAERMCDREDWPGLDRLRTGARAAFDRGHQLWPAATRAEYLLALRAPGPYAGAVVTEGAGQFAFGPLGEVAASTHTWSELAAHIPAGPLRTIVAHERIVRGEDLRGDASVDPEVLPVPRHLLPWEPQYPLAEYHPDRAEFAPPAPADLEPVTLPGPGQGLEPAEVEPELSALRELVTPWLTQSEGRFRAVAVEGDALSALAVLAGPGATVRSGELDEAGALALMAWTAASGGAHGRRRGMARGRQLALQAAYELAAEEMPADGPGEDSAATGAHGMHLTARLRWWQWDRATSTPGWRLALAVEDPDEGLAWAVEATDTA